MHLTRSQTSNFMRCTSEDACANHISVKEMTICTPRCYLPATGRRLIAAPASALHRRVQAPALEAVQHLVDAALLEPVNHLFLTVPELVRRREVVKEDEGVGKVAQPEAGDR